MDTTSFPSSSFFFSDNVQLSSSNEEINIWSLLPKLERCVKYLLSFSGSVICICSANESNNNFDIISSSKNNLGKINSVFVS